MKRSIYQEEKINKQKEKAVALYKQGLTLREVGKAVGKSHEWVNQALKELSPVDTIDNK
jgi:transposase-like protein